MKFKLSTYFREPCVVIRQDQREASVAVRMAGDNTFVIVMVRRQAGPRRRRSHGRTYALCRDLGYLHFALWSYGDA